MNFMPTPAAKSDAIGAPLSRTPSVSSSHSTDSLANLLSMPLLPVDSYEFNTRPRADRAGGLDLEAQMILERAQRRAGLQQRAMGPAQRLRHFLQQTATRVNDQVDYFGRRVAIYYGECSAANDDSMCHAGLSLCFTLLFLGCIGYIGYVIGVDGQKQSSDDATAAGTALARATLTSTVVATASALPSALRRSLT